MVHQIPFVIENQIEIKTMNSRTNRIPIGGSKGGGGGCGGPHRGPNSFICMQFSAKKLQNYRLAHPLWEFVPPQENPGSAIDSFIKSTVFQDV